MSPHQASNESRSTSFTDRWLNALEAPASGSIEHFDTHPNSPPSFGIRVFATGVKSFFLVYRRGGRKRRYTLGRYPQMSLRKARDDANTIHANRGDPMAVKDRALKAGSFAVVSKAWVEKATKAHNEPLSERTHREYRRFVETVFPKHKCFDALLTDVTVDDVELFLSELAEKSPATANRCCTILRNIYAYAEKKKYLDRAANFMRAMEKPAPRNRQRERVLENDEIRKIWLALDDEEALGIRAFFRMLFYCGTRKTETLKARWSDIRIDSRVWAIPGEFTKGGNPHEVPLSPPAFELVEALGTICGRTGYIFPGAKSGHHLVNPQEAKSRIGKRTGIEFRIHDIRRTVATGMASLGVRPDVVSSVLAHSFGIGVTRIYDRYSRLPEKRAALEKWATELKRIVSGEERSSVLSFPST